MDEGGKQFGALVIIRPAMAAIRSSSLPGIGKRITWPDREKCDSRSGSEIEPHLLV